MKSFLNIPIRLRSGELINLWRMHRRALIALVAFCAISNLMMLVPTLYMLQVFDRVMVSRSELTLLAMSLVAMYLFGLLAVTEWSRNRVLARISTAFDKQLSDLTFKTVFQENLNSSQGDAGRAFSDLNELRQFLSGTGLSILLDVPWTPIYIVVLYLMHPALAALSLVFICIQTAFAAWGQARLLTPAKQAIDASRRENEYLFNHVKSAEVFEALGFISNLEERWKAKRQDSLSAQFASQQLTHALSSSSKFIRYMQQSLTLAVGAVLVIRGDLSPGAMIAANVLTSRSLAPIDALAGSWKSFLSARDAYVRLADVLVETELEPAQAPRSNWQPELIVKNASVQVKERQAPLLSEIQFQAPAGSMTVVLGPSGSGKSTFLRMVLGIQPIDQGVILLDGVSIDRWPRAVLGPSIGYLPQTIDLLDGTVSENIARFGDVDSAKVVEAAKATGVHELILKLPKGYDSDIGESGRFLSGGFRQRIGLCRAIYDKPKLVVLDEPNANLDDAGEAALVQILSYLKEQGSTVILVTHRNQYLDLADRVLVLDQGLVQASGPKDGVMAALAR